MGFIDTITKPLDWLGQVAPAPVKFLMFLLFIIFFGGVITNMILSDKYGCDARGLLIDESVFRGCGKDYMAGLVWKLNISQEACYEEIGIDDPYLNSTICTEFLSSVKELTWWDKVKLGFSATSRNFVNWIRGIPTADSGRVSIFSYLSHPESALCSGLYDCLPPEHRDALNLASNCTIARGESHAVDGYPTLQEFLLVSLQNRSMAQEDIDEFKVFATQCTDLGRRQGYSPELTFLGIPIFSFELWLLIAVFGAFIWIIKSF